MDPIPTTITGAGSFSSQSSKAGRVNSCNQNLLKTPFSDKENPTEK
jgi:hypothetical protein